MGGHVEFTDVGIVVGLRRRQRRQLCPCGQRSRARYDMSRRRWRHLDMGRCGVWLEADIARIDCCRCGRVRTEQVPLARPGARLTRDLEDVIAWLAQRTDKTSICRLLRVSWQTVHRTVTRVVADHLGDTPSTTSTGSGSMSAACSQGFTRLPRIISTADRRGTSAGEAL
jgi:transposase